MAFLGRVFIALRVAYHFCYDGLASILVLQNQIVVVFSFKNKAAVSLKTQCVIYFVWTFSFKQQETLLHDG